MHDALTLVANVAWIDATYKKKYVGDGEDQRDLSGEPTGEPYFSAALGASYVWTLAGSGKIDLSAMHAYRGESRCNAESEFQGSCHVSPNFEVGEATNRTDVRLAWADENERWGAPPS